MKSARYYGPRDIRIDDISDPPAPGKDEVCLPFVMQNTLAGGSPRSLSP